MLKLVKDDYLFSKILFFSIINSSKFKKGDKFHEAD